MKLTAPEPDPPEVITVKATPTTPTVDRLEILRADCWRAEKVKVFGGESAGP